MDQAGGEDVVIGIDLVASKPAATFILLQDPHQLQMAYIDHAFSITDDDLMLDRSYSTTSNRAPIKEIALAVSLLVFGVVGIIADSFMVSNRVDGDRA
ncbi:hypothetical protein LINPERHAP2_LOCUS11414 [Linum perenne]